MLRSIGDGEALAEQTVITCRPPSNGDTIAGHEMLWSFSSAEASDHDPRHIGLRDVGADIIATYRRPACDAAS